MGVKSAWHLFGSKNKNAAFSGKDLNGAFLFLGFSTHVRSLL